LLENIGSNFKS